MAGAVLSMHPGRDRIKGKIGSMTRREDDSEAEARRILKQIDQEVDPSRSMLERSGKRVRDHMSAADADQDDSSELWGTRVGRVLSLVLLVVLVWYLAWMVLGEQ